VNKVLNPELEWRSGPGLKDSELQPGMWEFTGMGYWEFTGRGWRRIPGTSYYNGCEWVQVP
jgi:hypothetical protein